MTFLGKLGIGRRRRAHTVPSVAEVVAGSPVPVFGLDGEALDLRFRGFTYSEDEVELLFQRPTKMDFAPGMRIGSRRLQGNEPDRFVDMLIRSAAQLAALNFGTDKFRELAQPHLNDPENPFALLDQYPLSGSTEFIRLGNGWEGSALVWQWKLPQPLRAMALGDGHPIVVASYDLTTEQTLRALENVVSVNARPDLIAAYQAAFDERRAARHEGPAE